MSIVSRAGRNDQIDALKVERRPALQHQFEYIATSPVGGQCDGRPAIPGICDRRIGAGIEQESDYLYGIVTTYGVMQRIVAEARDLVGVCLVLKE